MLYHVFNINLPPPRHPEEIIPRCGKTTQDEPDYSSRRAGSSVTRFGIFDDKDADPPKKAESMTVRMEIIKDCRPTSIWILTKVPIHSS